MTIPARLQWIEYEAKRTADKIRTRREILDFYAATKREAYAKGGVLSNNASQTASVPNLMQSSQDKDAFASATFSQQSSWQTASCPALPSLDASQSLSASSPQASRKHPPGLGAFASRPVRSVTLNDRVKMASLMAHKNAMEVADRRDLIDYFKSKKKDANAEDFLGSEQLSLEERSLQAPDVKTCMKQYPLVGAGDVSMLDAPEVTAQALPPLHSPLGSNSIFSRVAACEKRMIHNHQVMSYHRQVLDEARARKKANDEAAAALLASMRAGLSTNIV
mmetsp:Transcript_6621/g.14426  ORF Transcript_6621/g.14426 Transcript_6621/m.14426 type:complete len:278 (-) Transcript_6621:51-884(-)